MDWDDYENWGGRRGRVMDSGSKSVEAYLKESEIHRQWEQAYRTAENEAFYERLSTIWFKR